MNSPHFAPSLPLLQWHHETAKKGPTTPAPMQMGSERQGREKPVMVVARYMTRLEPRYVFSSFFTLHFKNVPKQWLRSALFFDGQHVYLF
jgi:hypothetical protein